MRTLLAALLAFTALPAAAQALRSNDALRFHPASSIPVAAFMPESFAGVFERESHSEPLRELKVYEFDDAASVTDVDQALCARKVEAIVEGFPSAEKKIGFTDVFENRTRKFCLLSVLNGRPQSMHKERLFAAGFVSGRLYVIEVDFAQGARPAERQEFAYFLETLK